MTDRAVAASAPASPPARADASSRPRGLAWAAIALAIFSGWFVVTRLGLARQVDVMDVIALRFAGGALLLGPLLLGRSYRLPPRAWRQGLVLSLFWGVPFALLVSVGLKLTSAATAASITPTMTALFTGLVAWLTLGEVPSRWRLFGYACIVAGVVGLVVSEVPANGRIDPLGVAALVGASALWAMYTARFRAGTLSGVQAVALVSIISCAAFLPFYVGLGLSGLGALSFSELALHALYQGVLMSVVAMVAYNRAVALLGAGGAAAVMALVPVMATAAAVPVLGEVPTLGTALAICVIAPGVVLALAAPARRAVRAPTGPHRP
ncbi:DMT family transporter [Chelatococcus reniformis]|uniref:EamA domain-containing protein n=1 Tax=Chelatococcus reniformis TaxID=1494448 RepID=A0A916U4T2_9HYPH|nr:DMT family transporter [Chelatococcus reniformis]GGC60041.1 hypothetical protein GCM10010994_18390 [Chelatococcus reniformis]